MALTDIILEFGGIENNSLHKVIDDGNDNNIENIPPSSYININNLNAILQNNKDNFTILSLNVQSLNEKFDQIKIFLHDLNDHGHKISAICIQETWLSDQHDQLFFQLEGYNFISQPKTSSNHGGVGIYLSESYDYSELQLYTGSQVWDGMFIEVKAPSISKKTDNWKYI